MASPAAFDIRRVRAALPPSMQARVHARAPVESTQSVLLDAPAQWPDRTVVVTDHQTAGRGRRGRDWVSAPGASLALSMLARQPARQRWLPSVSLALGVAAVEAVHKLGAIPVRLKWPNDLVVGGHKLGGILVETCPAGIVAGAGINQALSSDLRAAIGSPCTDLAALGARATLEQLAVALIVNWNRALDLFAHDGLAAFHDRWRALDALADRPVTVWTDAHESVDGIARGIDPHGRLQVEIDGQLRVFAAADVSVRTA